MEQNSQFSLIIYPCPEQRWHTSTTHIRTHHKSHAHAHIPTCIHTYIHTYRRDEIHPFLNDMGCMELESSQALLDFQHPLGGGIMYGGAKTKKGRLKTNAVCMHCHCWVLFFILSFFLLLFFNKTNPPPPPRASINIHNTLMDGKWEEGRGREGRSCIIFHLNDRYPGKARKQTRKTRAKELWSSTRSCGANNSLGSEVNSVYFIGEGIGIGMDVSLASTEVASVTSKTRQETTRAEAREEFQGRERDGRGGAGGRNSRLRCREVTQKISWHSRINFSDWGGGGHCPLSHTRLSHSRAECSHDDLFPGAKPICWMPMYPV